MDQPKGKGEKREERKGGQGSWGGGDGNIVSKKPALFEKRTFHRDIALRSTHGLHPSAL